MRRSISSRLVWLWTNRAQVMNGTFLASMLALGTSHSVYGQCPPEEPPLAPILETFDGYVNGGIATLPNCWTMSPVSTSTSSQGWRIEDATTTSSSTGPNVDNTLGTTAGKYIYLETSGGSTGALSSFETSDISLDNLGPNRQLSFYYHMYGATMGTLTVEVYDGTTYNSVFSLSGEQQTSGAAPWQQATVSLAGYSGVVRIRFSGTRGSSFTGDMAIDDVSIDNPPACSAVSNPITSNLTSSSVDVSWTAGDPAATSWQVEYGAPGFTAGSGTIVPATGTPTATLTGLAPNTTYSILIREECAGSPGTFSPDVSTIITTLCAPVATWTENWDSYSGTGSSFSQWGCFERIGTATLAYLSTLNNSSPYSFYISGSSTSGYPVVLMPEVTTGGGTHRLELMGRSSSSTTTAWFLVGYCSDPTDASTFVATDSAEFVGTTFLPYTLTPGAIPTGAQMAFSRRVAGTAMYIDDLAWVAIPTCEPVTAMSATGATASSLDLSWSHTFGNAQDFNLEYGVSGFTPGSGTPANGVVGTSTTISGLMDNTTYDVYIQVNCGATDGLSVWNGPFSFTTACAETTTWSEDFEAYASGARPDCWSIVSSQGSFNVSTTTPATGLRSFYLYYSTSYTTPLVGTIKPVSNLGDGTHQLRFQGRSGSTTLNPILELGYVTNPSDANSFVSLGSATLVGTTYAEYIIQPSAATIPAGAIMAFRRGAVTTSVYIDDVVWEAIPTCPPVIGLSAGATGTSTALATWSAGGAETAWEWAIDTAGAAAPAAGTAVTDTFVMASGLTFGQSYDLYVRAACGPGDLSDWRVSTFSIDYCASSATLSADSKIGMVAVGNDSVVASTACAQYTDNTALAPFNLQFAVPTQVVVEYYSCSGTNYGSYAKVFVDFNDDLSFDASEVIAEGNASAGATLVANANMPASGIVGLHRMRVVLRESGSTTSTEGCGTYSYGETQDFMVDVAAAPACAPPTGIAAVAVYGYQATLAWSSSETNFELEVGASGFTPTGVATATATDTFAVVTGLTPSTAYQYYVRTVCGGTSSPWVGPFSFTTTVSCPAPTFVGGTASPTAVTFNWTSNGLATDYNYAVIHQDSTLKPADIMSTQALTATVTGLSDNTPYRIYVRDSCGAGDVSSWVTVNYTSPCNAQIAPYVQTFDSWTTNTQGLFDCWSLQAGQNVSGPPFWRSNVGATGSSGTGPATGNGGSGGYIFLETSVSNDDIAYSFSPLVDINSLNAPELTFFYHMYGATIGTLTVDVWNGASWVNVWDTTGQIQNSDVAPWNKKSISLAAFSDTIQVRFGGTRNGSFTGDMAIDDVRIDEVPACNSPSNLASSYLTGDTAIFVWDAGDANATMWNVEYGPTGFSIGSGTSMTVTDTFAVLGGLTDRTTYDIYVSEKCVSNAGYSLTVTTSFTTACPASIAAPYMEDFSTANISPFFSDFGNCWSTNAASTSVFRWEAEDATGINENSTGTGPFWDNTSFGVAGGVYMYVEASSGSAGSTTELYAPTVDISGLNNPAFTFYYHMYGATTGTLEVQVSDDGGATWTSAWSLSGQQQTAGGDSWIQAIVSLNGYGNLVDVKFIGTRGSSFDGDISIDDVAYEEGPACFPPSGLSASTTPTTATLSWNSTDMNATTWFVEYGAQGFAQGSGTSVTVTDTFASITGLSSQTTYDYYVIEQCAGTTDSSAAASSSFTTGITVPYFEGFDAGYPPVGWTEATGNIAEPTVLSGTTSGWSNDTWLNGPSNNAMKENLFSTGDDEWAFTPGIEIPAGMDVELSFDIAVLAWNSTTAPGVMDADDSVMVVISTDGTWNRSNAVYVLHSGNQFSGTNTNVAIDISAYAGNTIQIGFYDETTVSGSDLDIMFDNISVTEICEDYNASAEEIGTYRVRFKWDDMGTAFGYTLNLREVGGSTWSTFFTTDTFRVLDNRAPGDYEFYISAVDLPNACSVSNVTVSCADDIVYTYNAFQAPELGRYGRVRVFGTQGGKRLYDIYLVNSNGDTTGSTNVRQRNFTDLAADSYMIYVTDDFGCVADSVGQFTINSMDTAWIPNLINAPNNSPNGFRPTWNSVGGVINYQLRILNVTDGTLVNFITGITDTMRAVTGLTPGKLYRFNVRSRYNNGVATVNSGYSNPVSRNLPAGGNKEGDASDIAENAAELISVYPNPVANVLFVSAPAASEVALMDLNGKVIAVRSINGQEVSFDMSSLAGGVYMVRITNADQVTIQKVVKQ